MVGIRVLGPLAAEVGGVQVGLGGPRQRAVLALLVSAGGQVVSADRMIEDLWQGEPPPSALASLQAYVSNLRRALEPGRSRRAPARVLVSAAPGYAVRLDEGAVDAWRFEDLVRRARAEPDAGRAGALLDEALGLWRGPAYAEFADEPWALAEAARLEETRLAARELSIASLLRAGEVAEAVPRAETLVGEQPLREEAWRLLALALWAAGRQADALAALRRVRAVLAEDLGLDPGPALAELEQAILGGRVEVLRSATGAPRAADAPQAPAVTRAEPAPAGETFIGRERELAEIAAQARDAVAGTGRVRIVMVSGEAGAGKTTLLAQAARKLAGQGWLVAVGRCPEAEGAPPAWAWVELLRSLAERAPAGDFAERLAPLLGEGTAEAGPDTAGGRFRLHRAVCAWLEEVSRTTPLALVLDDLHAADAETLALLAAVASEPAGPILLVPAYRDTDLNERRDERFADVLAVLARRSPARIALGGLDRDEVARLMAEVCGTAPDETTVLAVADRTGGNPFYVRESARLMASEGALVALSEVPEGVRDVLRRRLARLPAPAVAVLRLAAVAGREADVDVVVEAADADEAGVLDALEAGLISGLLTEPAPGRVRFAHDLVRDTLYQDLSRLRRTRMHARLGEAVERLRPDDLPGLAHHFGRAASAATAGRAVDYAVRAAELARARYAHDAEVELLEQAVTAYERMPGADDDRRVELLGRLMRAQVRAGAVLAARTARDRAIEVAERAGREDLLIAAFTGWTEPTVWERRVYGTVDERVVGLLSRLLERAEPSPVQRCRLLDALSAELPEDDPRAGETARATLALAREIGDPELLALGLAAEARLGGQEDMPELRARAAAELTELGAEHGLPLYEWTGEYLSGTTAAVLGDIAGLRAHAARSREIARACQLPEALALEDCRDAMLAHVAGRFDEAETRYLEATERLLRHGSPHALGMRALAIMSVRLSQGRVAEHEPALRTLARDFGSPALDALALSVAAAGRPGEARRLRAKAPPVRRDYFFTVFMTLRALAVVALDERAEAAGLYPVLLPYRDRLPGAITNSVVMQPVAHTLGELALLLDRPAEAAGHFAKAVEVARRWESPHWERAAADALAGLQDSS